LNLGIVFSSPPILLPGLLFRDFSDNLRADFGDPKSVAEQPEAKMCVLTKQPQPHFEAKERGEEIPRLVGPILYLETGPSGRE
jgi:hypothetical protein